MKKDGKVYYQKLVRDGIPAKIAGKGFAYEARPMEEEEYRAELYRKIHEETAEIVPKLSREELIKELCDVRAVLEAIRELSDVTDEEFDEAYRKQCEKKGTYKDRTYLEWSADDGYVSSVEHGEVTIEPGLYRHYKGGEYEVFFTARHTESHQWVVVYRSLEYDALRVRPYDMFVEEVRVDGKMVPRFERVESATS